MNRNNRTNGDKFTRDKSSCYCGVSSKLISDQQSPILVSLFLDIFPLLIIRLLILTKTETLALRLLPLWKFNGFQGHHCHCHHWMNGLESIHWNQMEWQWFSMVCNHWSNDGMAAIHRCGLIGIDTFLHPVGNCRNQSDLNLSSPAPCSNNVINFGEKFNFHDSIVENKLVQRNKRHGVEWKWRKVSIIFT